MRKVTNLTAGAFFRGYACSNGNTVCTGNDLFLHGNLIAQRRPDGSVVASLAGWPTVTTRDRLNGLCGFFGLSERFYQKQEKQYFGTMRIMPDEWVTLVGGDH